MRNAWIPLGLLLACGCDAVAGAGSDKPIGVKQGTNHRVRPGESLTAIAEEAYGNGMEWYLIWEANSWIDPDHIRAGEIIYIPPRDPSLAESAPRGIRAADPPLGSFDDAEGAESAPANTAGRSIAANPGRSGSGSGGMSVLRNLATNVSSRTVFGMSIEKALLFGFGGFLGHAIFQGILVWLAANITFVKEATFWKSLKAVLLAESLTFATLLVLAGVGVLMIYLGSDPSGTGDTKLFPALESYLQSATGLAIAGLIVFALYATLSLRFLPQVFGIPMSRATTLMAIAILVPHLAGAYLVGQRTGLIR